MERYEAYLYGFCRWRARRGAGGGEMSMCSFAVAVTGVVKNGGGGGLRCVPGVRLC